MSHLPLSHRGKIPAVPSARPRQNPVSRVSAPYCSQVQHPPSVVCVSSCSPLFPLEPMQPAMGRVAARPTWSLIPYRSAETNQASESWGGQKRKRTFLFPWGYNQEHGFGVDQELSQKNQSTLLTCSLGMGLYPLVWLTGLYGPAPSPGPPTIWYWKGEGGSVNPLSGEVL